MGHRALIYVRVSKDQRQGRSVAQQEMECRTACDEEGWEIVDVVTDNDVGASRHSKGRRHGWERVQQLLGAGEADVLVTWEGSRAQRDLESFVALRKLCVARGVRWHYGGRTFDMTKSRDRRDTARDAVDAEGESDMTSERIRRDKRAAAAAGRPTGRRLYGYRRIYDPSTGALEGQEPHPEEAPIVARIFADYLSGKGARTIATDLNREDVRRPETGVRAKGETESRRVRAQWADTQVKRVLTNPAYIGMRVHRGELVGDAVWPPLVDRETFDRVQARFEGRRGIQQKATVRLLTGVARCGVCGGKMACGKDRYDRRVYQCRQGFHTARDMLRLDAWVTVAVLDRLKRPDIAEALDGTPDPKVAEARAHADELRGRLDDAIRQFSAGELSAATLAKIEQDLSGKIAEAERAARAALVPLDIEVPADVDAWWDSLEREQQREVVGALVAAVVVHLVGKGRRAFDPADRTDLEWRR